MSVSFENYRMVHPFEDSDSSDDGVDWQDTRHDPYRLGECFGFFIFHLFNHLPNISKCIRQVNKRAKSKLNLGLMTHESRAVSLMSHFIVPVCNVLETVFSMYCSFQSWRESEMTLCCHF